MNYLDEHEHDPSRNRQRDGSTHEFRACCAHLVLLIQAIAELDHNDRGQSSRWRCEWPLSSLGPENALGKVTRPGSG